MKKKMFYPPLRDEFTKFGDKFEKIAHNEVNGMYCYKRTTSDGLTYYEVQGSDGQRRKREHLRTLPELFGVWLRYSPLHPG